MIRSPTQLPLLVALGMLAGFLDVRWPHARRRTGVLAALAFGAGFVLVRQAFRYAWVGFPLIGYGASTLGHRPQWRSTLSAASGAALTMLFLRKEVALAVAVLGLGALVLLVSGCRSATGRTLGPLVAVSLVSSQFGLYVAVPDTEAAIAAGAVAIGLAVSAVVFGSELSTLTAVSVVLLVAMLGSAQSVTTLLATLPVVGVFAVLAMPNLGARLEARLIGDQRLQLVTALAHLAVCSLPRWLIVGHT